MTIERARQLAIRFGLCTALVLGFAGCNRSAQGTTGNAAEQNGTDPADANMAAANGQPAQVLAQNVQYAPRLTKKKKEKEGGYIAWIQRMPAALWATRTATT